MKPLMKPYLTYYMLGYIRGLKDIRYPHAVVRRFGHFDRIAYLHGYRMGQDTYVQRMVTE